MRYPDPLVITASVYPETATNKNLIWQSSDIDVATVDQDGNVTIVGVGNPGELAGGISQALTTTAAGLTVAIIAYMFHRYFRGRVDELVIEMEQQAIKLVDVMHSKNINIQGVNK